VTGFNIHCRLASCQAISNVGGEHSISRARARVCVCNGSPVRPAVNNGLLAYAGTLSTEQSVAGRL